MLLTVYDTEWPILCWCAVKKLLTHSLIFIMERSWQRSVSVSEQEEAHQTFPPIQPSTKQSLSTADLSDLPILLSLSNTFW